MSDEKYSPGHWHYHASEYDPHVWEITADWSESPIAEVARWKDGDGNDNEYARANLALILAAPKLLDALRKCVFAVECVAHLQGNAEAMAYAEYGRAALAAAATLNDRDAMPPPQEWGKLRAEWIHDYGLRHLEDRAVRYEDDPIAWLPEWLRAPLEGNVPLPSPGDIAEDSNRLLPDSPEEDRGPDKGRGRRK